jgi:hypothetical protein
MNSAQLAKSNAGTELINSLLGDLARLRASEDEQFQVEVGDFNLDLARLRSVWLTFEQWVNRAEQIRSKVCAEEASNLPHGALTALDDGIGCVRARLSVTPEQIAKANEQVRRGQWMPAKELRDEFNSRLRA